jgi:hypothetical protein
MSPLDDAQTKIVRGRSDYNCEAEPCLLTTTAIANGELHVASPNEKVVKDDRGRLRPDFQRTRFKVRYHLLCYMESKRATQDRAFMQGDLSDLVNFDMYKQGVADLLALQEAGKK